MRMSVFGHEILCERIEGGWVAHFLDSRGVLPAELLAYRPVKPNPALAALAIVEELLIDIQAGNAPILVLTAELKKANL